MGAGPEGMSGGMPGPGAANFRSMEEMLKEVRRPWRKYIFLPSHQGSFEMQAVCASLYFRWLPSAEFLSVCSKCWHDLAL